MPITVRDARPGDEATVVQLVAELAQTIAETSPLTERYVGEYLAFPGCGILLAEEDNHAVGLLSYSMRPNLYHAAQSTLIEELVVS